MVPAQKSIRRVRLLSILVGLNGILILGGSLVDQFSLRHGLKLEPLVIDIPVILGITLIYLASLLNRQKQTAWVVTTVVYAFYLGISLSAVIASYQDHILTGAEILRRVALPALVLFLLQSSRDFFIVRSEPGSYRAAMRISSIVLAIAFLYGTTGFILMDKSDFRQEITLKESIHYTIDQFDLTTNKPLRPYTNRARVFEDSLSLVSTLAVAFVIVSLFQPIKTSLGGDEVDRKKAKLILDKYKAPSEEFFKIWPKDKHYFFDHDSTSFLAYHVYRGVALCLSDPVGKTSTYKTLITEFKTVCFNNDWQPAFVHVNSKTKSLLESQNFNTQKLGEEAVMDLAKFVTTTSRNKYFRHINNKFTKQGYVFEIVKPPHDQQLVNDLGIISSQWLSRGSRAERGFAMGYFKEEYLQMCEIAVIRDGNNKIQAFANLVPANFDNVEATYDMLRYSDDALGNINDFLLIKLAHYLETKNFKRLNLGFCPLVGLDEVEKDKRTLIDRVLKFAYANGDRFYSFNGLYRFKDKYEPDWQSRYLAYTKGLPGFSKAISAVIMAMKVDL